MGAEYQERIVTTDDSGLTQVFHEIVEGAKFDHGHSGYSGTFAEKLDLEIIDGVWEEAQAEDDCTKRNDKWGPAWAYKLHDGRWYIGGWCSS